MSEEKMLVKKLAKVMSDVKHIEKRGYNKFNNYHYATESDVAEKVREVLAEQHVVMLPDVIEHTTREHINRKGNTEYIATVKVKFTFIDGETGEELSIHSAGEGQDTGDKAVYKAITGAQKYALMKAFMIPTHDDPEADNGAGDQNNSNKQHNTKPATDNQLNYVNKLLTDMEKNSDKSRDELYQGIKKRMGIEKDMEQWAFEDASKAIKILTTKKSA